MTLRLELFVVVLFGLLACSCSWTLGLDDTASGSGIALETGQGQNWNLREKREVSESEESAGHDIEKECDQVTEDEINHLVTAIQEALRNVSSLYSNPDLFSSAHSNNDSVAMDSSDLDSCQQWILEMKAVTGEISNLAELLQEKILNHESVNNSDSNANSNLESQRLEEALETKTGQLNSLASQLENKLKHKWNGTASRMTFEIQLLTEELNELQTEILGPIRKVKGKNFNLFVHHIRLGNLATAKYYSENTNDSNENSLFKSIIQEAYDGVSLDYFRHTLTFARYVSLSLDPISYPTLFEKVNGSISTGGHGPRSDPRVLFPLSTRLAESIWLHKNSNLSVPAILQETDKSLDELITGEILEPWASSIRSGNLTHILQFEEKATSLELVGLRMFLLLLVNKAYGNSSDNFQATLNFVSALKSPRFRSSGLLKLYDEWNLEQDHGTRLAFQIKKLLESPEIQGTEDEAEIRTEMTRVKAVLPNWERLAVWGSGTCNIQSYETGEYMYAPDDYYTRSNDKRELFTSTFEQLDNTTEWTFHPNPADEGTTFQIYNSGYEDEMLVSNGHGRVYLRNGMTSFSHSADWAIERVKRDQGFLFTIKNGRNGTFLYPGDVTSAWDSDHPRVLAKSEFESDSFDQHLWVLRCDEV